MAEMPTVAFCPHCGAALGVQAFVQEYSSAESRIFHVWCNRCRFAADVRPTERMLGVEPARA